MHLGLSKAVVGAVLLHSAVATTPKAKNFIYVVPDGYGIASQVLARDFYSLTEGDATTGRPNAAQIGVDSMMIGSVRTYASDNLVTDSAASGTAFACGVKTYNGAIGVDDDGEPVGSILEAAHLKGLKTGMIVTSRITHATPACYSAHVLDRDSENEIAAQQIGYSHPLGSVADLLIGGGRRHYLPKEAGGNREDGVNLIDWAVGKGYNYAADREDLEGALDDGKLPLPFLGLLANSHLDYELDRNTEKQPSLLQLVEYGLDTLEAATKKSKKGYFLMVEASRIDHAAHANDAAAHVHDTLMFNEVMAFLKTYVSKRKDTQLLSAADHECGGLTLEDDYDPTVLTRAQYSGETLTSRFEKESGDDKAAYLRDVQLPLYGLDNYTDADVSRWIDIYENKGSQAMAEAITLAFAAEAGLHFSTNGHTAADVQLHAYAADKKTLDYMRQTLGTNNNNIVLPRYVEKALGVSMDGVTKDLRKNGTDWIEGKDKLEMIKRENSMAKKHVHHS
jgi:alkaline phosphatase